MLFDVRKDFCVYAPKALRVLTKKGSIEPFTLNRAQRYIHERLEQQRAEKGWVRAIVLKARQMGASTYIEGRFYWRITGEFGKRAFIMTHSDDATENLFNMTKRYNDNCPPAYRPHTKIENAKELYFNRLDSRYSVATAGGRAAGRSAAAQMLHGSEVAFWPKAEANMAGIGQVIPLVDDTEIILESTANGIGNYFHQTCLDAMAGVSDYIFIFTPWFWDDTYRRLDCPRNIEWTEEELEYQLTFGLDDQQMYFRRMKIKDDFKGDSTLFDQEYPATPEMAFLAGTKDSLISPLIVQRACYKRKIEGNEIAPIIIGVDPAEYGEDESSITVRHGRIVLHREDHVKEGNEQIAGRVVRLADRFKPDAINVDVTGVGTGVEAFLSATIHDIPVNRIHFGGKPIESEKYVRRGDEMWGRMFDWFLDEPCSIPENDHRLKSELTTRKYKYDASRRLVIEPKEKMRDRGLKSPGRADSLALTFAVDVRPRPKAGKKTLEDKLRELRAAAGRRSTSPGATA